MAVTSIRELQNNPEYNSLSDEAKDIVFERVRKEDVDFQNLSSEAQNIVKQRVTFTEMFAPTVLPPERTAGEKVGDIGFEMAGGIVGGALAAGRKTPMGAALAALFSGGGEAIRQIGQQAEALTGIDLPFVRGEEAPRTSLEAARRIGGAGLAGGLGEVGGRGLVKGLGMAKAALRPVLRPGAKEAIEAVESLIPRAKAIRQPLARILRLGKQAPILPSEATASPVLDLFQGVAKTSVFGGKRIINQQKFIDDVVSETIDSIVMDKTGRVGPSAIGELMLNSVDDGISAFSATANGMFGQVDDLTEGAIVGMSTLKGTARKIASQRILKTGEQTQLLNQIIELPDNISFAQAQDLRSDLIKIGRSGTELIKGKAQGTAKQLSKVIDTSMNTSAKELSGDALTAWRNANSFWKTGKNTFNSRFIRGVANAEPSVALEKLLKAGPEDIIKARKIINNPDIWKKVQGAFADKLLNNSISDEISKTINGRTLLKGIRQNIKKGNLQAIAPKGELKAFKDFATALALNQAKQPGGQTFKVVLAMSQGTALLYGGGKFLTTGEIDPASVAILMGPLVLSRALTNPAVAKALTVGFKTPATVKEATKLAVRLTAILAKNKIEAQVLQGEEIGLASQERVPTQPPPLEDIGPL